DLAYKDVDDYKNYLDYLTDEITRLKSKYFDDNGPVNLNGPVEVENIMNPPCSRSKGGVPNSNTTVGRRRRPGSCGGCSAVGHNIRFLGAGWNSLQTCCGCHDEKITDT
ncbi:hypothetical protein A2U01_0056466, partial [Trifolium medium]|nr:hypothetical protein [Trifolium medium]